MDRVWDQQYVEEMGDHFPWIQQQWDSMCRDTYWDNDGDDHLEYDFDAGISVPYCTSAMTMIRFAVILMKMSLI